jgi:Mg2+/Co2+ transporter CorB
MARTRPPARPATSAARRLFADPGRAMLDAGARLYDSTLDQVSLPLLWGLLAGCLLLSAFFSGTETALMSINRYQLRTLARQGDARAAKTERLLSRPDRPVGLILLGNNLVNNLAATVVAVIVLRIWSDEWLAVGAGVLTLVMLVFREVGPKTVGALQPRPLALGAAPIYLLLERVLSPLVWIVNRTTTAALRLVGVNVSQSAQRTALTEDELRTVVAEAGTLIPQHHRDMLISILDLERLTVDDITVHRQAVAGIDLDDPWETILDALRGTSFTRLPVYRGELDRIVGVLHMKSIARQLSAGTLDAAGVEALAEAREPYFIPAGTSLTRQLLDFKRKRRRMGFVVDEYGEIQGLVTMDDLLEEIVGEFTTGPAPTAHPAIHQEGDGAWRIDATTSLRAINRRLGWQLPTDEATTLNGLLLERLGEIPRPGSTLRVGAIELTVVDSDESRVRAVRARTIAKPD